MRRKDSHFSRNFLCEVNVNYLDIMPIFAAMSRYFLYLSYHGAAYHGWQVQHNALTVQGVLNDKLTALLRQPTATFGAGRTDAGVHARLMVAHFDASQPNLHLDKKFLHSLNHMLPNDIAVERMVPVQDTANARFDAVAREYEYVIVRTKTPFALDSAWRYTSPLDLEQMQMAASKLLLYSDFTSFSKLGTDTATNLCQIHTARWDCYDSQQRLVFTIRANRFLRNMVRAIVGTLVDVGRGYISVEQFEAIIEAKDRSKACASAPAHGLFLTKVEYPQSIFL